MAGGKGESNTNEMKKIIISKLQNAWVGPINHPVKQRLARPGYALLECIEQCNPVFSKLARLTICVASGS